MDSHPPNHQTHQIIKPITPPVPIHPCPASPRHQSQPHPTPFPSPFNPQSPPSPEWTDNQGGINRNRQEKNGKQRSKSGQLALLFASCVYILRQSLEKGTSQISIIPTPQSPAPSESRAPSCHLAPFVKPRDARDTAAPCAKPHVPGAPTHANITYNTIEVGKMKKMGAKMHQVITGNKRQECCVMTGPPEEQRKGTAIWPCWYDDWSRIAKSTIRSPRPRRRHR